MTDKPAKPPLPTDAQLYDENALSYVKQGAHAEIKPDSPSWDSWKAYFRQIGHKWMSVVMAGHEDRTWIGKHGVMVPTEWPSDFDETAPRLPPTRSEPDEIEGTAKRADVVRRALANAGFVPKEYRRTRPVAPHELVGEMRERRQREVEAELANARRVASEPLPQLSDTAKAAAGIPSERLEAAE